VTLARLLVDTHRLRILSRPLGVARIDAGTNAVQLQFGPAASVDPQRVVALVRSRPGHRIIGADRLRIDVPLAATPERVALLRRTLEALAGSGPLPGTIEAGSPRPLTRPAPARPEPAPPAARRAGSRRRA